MGSLPLSESQPPTSNGNAYNCMVGLGESMAQSRCPNTTAGTRVHPHWRCRDGTLILTCSFLVVVVCEPFPVRFSLIPAGTGAGVGTCSSRRRAGSKENAQRGEQCVRDGCWPPGARIRSPAVTPTRGAPPAGTHFLSGHETIPCGLTTILFTPSSSLWPLGFGPAFCLPSVGTSALERTRKTLP